MDEKTETKTPHSVVNADDDSADCRIGECRESPIKDNFLRRLLYKLQLEQKIGENGYNRWSNDG